MHFPDQLLTEFDFSFTGLALDANEQFSKVDNVLLFVLAEKTVVEFHCVLDSLLLVEIVHIQLHRTRILPVWWMTKSSNVWSIWARLPNRTDSRSGSGTSFRLRTRLRCSNLTGLGGCPMFFRWSSIQYFFSFFYGNFTHILKNEKFKTLRFQIPLSFSPRKSLQICPLMPRATF